MEDVLETVYNGSLVLGAMSTGAYYLWRARSTSNNTASGGFVGSAEAAQNEASRSRRVKHVIVRTGQLVDGVTFCFDTGESAHFGGHGGRVNAAFEVRDDEHIVEVRGRAGAYVDAIHFVTSTGRESEVFGHPENGRPFSFKAGFDMDIGGLQVKVSGNGWLRSIRGVIDSSKALSLSQTEPVRNNVNLVQFHQKNVRRRRMLLHLFVLIYGALFLVAMGPLATDLVFGPCDMDHEMLKAEVPSCYYVQLPRNHHVLFKSQVFSSGRDSYRWILTNVSLDPRDSVRILFRENVPLEEVLVTNIPRERRGILRRFNALEHPISFNQELGSGRWLFSSTPDFYLDETFLPSLVVVSYIFVMGFCVFFVRQEYLQRIGACDPVLSRLETDGNQREIDVAEEIDDEIVNGRAIVFEWRSSVVAVSRNWLVKATLFGLDAVAIDDARLVNMRLSQAWIDGEQVDVISLRIESRRSVTYDSTGGSRAMYFFDVCLPRVQFEELQHCFINRVNERQEKLLDELKTDFSRRVFNHLTDIAEEHGFIAGMSASEKECLGCCGRPPLVKIMKSCISCEERDECPCEPAWCHKCLLEWWFTRNRTKLEIALSSGLKDVSLDWQGQCPTCRTYFCLKDLRPRKDFQDFVDDNQTDTEGEEIVPESSKRERAARAAEARLSQISHDD